MTEKENALEFLYKQLKKAKIALHYAENRQTVNHEEVANLEKKIAAIDWLIPLALKEEEATP